MTFLGITSFTLKVIHKMKIEIRILGFNTTVTKHKLYVMEEVTQIKQLEAIESDIKQFLLKRGIISETKIRSE